MNRQQIAAEVAKDLKAAEAAIDEALRRTAELVGRLPQARIQARMSAVVGQDAFDKAAATVSVLTQARRHIVETHQELFKTQLEMRIPTLANGPGDDKPPETTGVLRVVEPRAA